MLVDKCLGKMVDVVTKGKYVDKGDTFRGLVLAVNYFQDAEYEVKSIYMVGANIGSKVMVVKEIYTYDIKYMIEVTTMDTTNEILFRKYQQMHNEENRLKEERKKIEQQLIWNQNDMIEVLNNDLN